MSQQDSLFQEPAARREDSPTPFASPQSREADLAAQLKAANRTLSNVLILLLVVSGTLTIFLLQAVRVDRANLAAVSAQAQQLPQAREIITNYNEQSVPAMKKFIDQLVDYAKIHPDVMPIMAKYGLARPATSPSAAPAGSNP